MGELNSQFRSHFNMTTLSRLSWEECWVRLIWKKFCGNVDWILHWKIYYFCGNVDWILQWKTHVNQCCLGKLHLMLFCFHLLMASHATIDRLLKFINSFHRENALCKRALYENALCKRASFVWRLDISFVHFKITFWFKYHV